MNSVMKIFVGTAFVAVLSLSTTAVTQAAEVMTLKPLQALSFNAEVVPRAGGRVRASQYYPDTGRVG